MGALNDPERSALQGQVLAILHQRNERLEAMAAALIQELGPECALRFKLVETREVVGPRMVTTWHFEKREAEKG